MKKRVLFIIPLVLFLSGCASSVNLQNSELEKEPITLKIAENSTIVCFGDSLTNGHGADHDTESWPAVLQRRVNIPVVNSGIDDDTTERGVARFQTDVLDHNPAILIFDFGGNDLYYPAGKLSYKQIETNFRTMLDQIDFDSTQVYLMRFYNDEMRFLDPFYKFDNILKRLEDDYPVIVIWDAWSDAWGHKDCKYDMTHCNAKGYEIMERNIFKVLEPCLVKNNLLKS